MTHKLTEIELLAILTARRELTTAAFNDQLAQEKIEAVYGIKIAPMTLIKLYEHKLKTVKIYLSKFEEHRQIIGTIFYDSLIEAEAAVNNIDKVLYEQFVKAGGIPYESHPLRAVTLAKPTASLEPPDVIKNQSTGFMHDADIDENKLDDN